MYKGFNLQLTEDNISDGYYDDGNAIHSTQKKLVKSTLFDFCKPNGSLDASKMQESWFPQIKSQLFISHSHQDEKLAITLAGYLNYEFGIESFIDSCAWGYSADLLKSIDDEFCWNDGSETYNYQKRNRSTSHVHMMLSTALAMMLDQCECLIFLNTPSSISPNKVITGSDGTTKSPWIYSEIAMTRLLRRRSRNEHRGLVENMNKALTRDKKFEFEHDVNLDHLVGLDLNDLKIWKRKFEDVSVSTPSKALDILYSLK